MTKWVTVKAANILCMLKYPTMRALGLVLFPNCLPCPQWSLPPPHDPLDGNLTTAVEWSTMGSEDGWFMVEAQGNACTCSKELNERASCNLSLTNSNLGKIVWRNIRLGAYQGEYISQISHECLRID